MHEITDIMLGLVSDASLGPLMDNLVLHYESPLDIYKMSILLYKNRFVRWIFKAILYFTGNGRILKSLGSMRQMSKKEFDTYALR